MDVLNIGRGEFDEGMPVLGDKTLETVGDAVDILHAVDIVQLKDNAPDNVIDPRTEPSTSNNTALGLGRVKEDLPPGP